jgi:hypothetical protein
MGEMFNTVDVKYLAQFCKKYNVGLIINDGVVVQGKSEIRETEKK